VSRRHSRRSPPHKTPALEIPAASRSTLYRDEALEQTHRAYVRAVGEAIGWLWAIDTELRDLLALTPLKARIERLRCFRGIDDLTASIGIIPSSDARCGSVSTARRRRASRARQLATDHGHVVPTREYQNDSSSLPLGRSDDRVNKKGPPLVKGAGQENRNEERNLPAH
jgi:hypothetical protein